MAPIRLAVVALILSVALAFILAPVSADIVEEAQIHVAPVEHVAEIAGEQAAHGISVVHTVVESVKSSVAAYIPPTVQGILHDFAWGATSVVSLGQGVDFLVKLTPSTGGCCSIFGHAVQKLFFSLGSISAEVMLLWLLYVDASYRPGRWTRKCETSSEVRQMIEKMFQRHSGFVVLVALSLIPNGFMDVTYIVALIVELPMSTVVPAMVIGKLLKPYAISLLVAVSPSSLDWWTQAESFPPVLQQGTEVLVWLTLAAAIGVSCYSYFVREKYTDERFMDEMEDAIAAADADM